MGYPLQFAIRYLGAKKRASISVGTAFAILGVALGVAALATIMSVTGGFHDQFRSKVLGVNAHVLVLKYSTNFREYRNIMEQVAKVDGVVGVAPFSINPMMLSHDGATATGVLVKGVDPRLSLGVETEGGDEWKGLYQTNQPVLDLPAYIKQGSLNGLRRPGARPAASKYAPLEPGDIEGRDSKKELREAIEDAGDDVDERLDSPEQDIPVPQQRSATPKGSAKGAERPPGTKGKPNPGTFLGGGGDDDDDDDEAGGEPPSAEDEVDRAGVGRPALPDEDDLPEDIEADPCDDPELVKDMPGVVVGSSLAKTLKLKSDLGPDGEPIFRLGDCVTITSPTIGFSFAAGQIKPPVAKQFRVIAIFEAGFDQYDSKLVYTDLYEAQTFYDHGDTVTGIEMKVDDIDRAGEIADEIAGVLASGLYHTMDWEELNHGLFTALRIQQVGMSAVLAIIIIVAAFTVIATLIMVVLDKQKEISVLKAMGATDEAVLRMFLYQGGIVGLLGTTIGLVLGLAVCQGLLIYGFPLDPKVYFISQLPVQVRWQEFAITGTLAVVICLVATIIPSMYAANLRPADGFRNQ
jgi:lipoprotein-releasing system permease protein